MVTRYGGSDSSDRSDSSDSSDRSVATETPKRRRLPRIAAAIALLALLGGAIGAIVWSRRPELRDVPVVEGFLAAEGTTKIEAEDLVVTTELAQYSETVAEGAIISQDPMPPRRLKKGETVTIVVSRGPEPIDVPSLADLTLDQATAVLARTPGLSMASPPRFENSETIPAGGVISWSPRAPQLPGTTINLVVSSGPASVAVPKVAGMTPADARGALPSKLVVTIVEVYSDNVARGKVIGTNPKSGSEVAPDAGIKVLVSLGPSTVVVPSVIDLSVQEATIQLRAVGLKVDVTRGPPDLPVKHTRPVRRSKVKRGTAITLYTTSDGVPPLPGEEPTTTAVTSTDSNATADTKAPDTKAPDKAPVTKAPATTKKPSTSAKPSNTETTKPSSTSR